MSANTFGHLFKVHSFGESHGTALGAVIDGCPAGVAFDSALIQQELNRRRPGGDLTSPRREADQVEILSGVYEGKTLGTPIAMVVRNQDARSGDYTQLAPRPGHADDVWRNKFGHSDSHGGGRSSGRETIARVLGGAVARMVLGAHLPQLRIQSWSHAIGPFSLTKAEEDEFLSSNQSADAFAARFPSRARGEEMQNALAALKSDGNSWGGIGEILLQSVPAGLGQPVFHKLKSELTGALMSVGAVSAVEMGDGLHQPDSCGVEFHRGSQSVYGGIRGGISTGENIRIKVHIKPTSSILDVAKKGRHDPCILIRALPVFEAMAALVLCDHFLWQRLDRV